MDDFNGFYPETTDALMGIRFNNNKEYFHANTDKYDEYVTKPIKLLAEGLLERIKEYDKDFDEEIRICRPNRDIRFSKNKNPYKESKWFFFRKDKISEIEYNRPNFFFEITPDGYMYGLGFWPNAKRMKIIREYLYNNKKDFDKILKDFNNQKAFILDGEDYKRTFYKDITDEKNVWLQKKGLTLIKKSENEKVLYKKELLDEIFKDIINVYPIYKSFIKISLGF